MTQEHITGFASELVKMAQAVAAVPELEARISDHQENSQRCTEQQLGQCRKALTEYRL